MLSADLTRLQTSPAPKHPAQKCPGQKRPFLVKLLRDTRGQSLLEAAVSLPVLVMLVLYAVDFGFFFIAANSISSSARNAAQYSTAGYSSPSQGGLPTVGSTSTSQSVAGVAYANMSGYQNASTIAVQLCTNNNGAITCNSSPSGSSLIQSSYQPDADPEGTLFQLNRVDVVYTISPPIPMHAFSTSLVPSLNFHRMSEMRVIN